MDRHETNKTREQELEKKRNKTCMNAFLLCSACSLSLSPVLSSPCRVSNHSLLLLGAASKRAQERRQDRQRQPGARLLARGAAAARHAERAGALPRARAHAPGQAAQAHHAADHAGGTGL